MDVKEKSPQMCVQMCLLLCPFTLTHTWCHVHTQLLEPCVTDTSLQYLNMCKRSVLKTSTEKRRKVTSEHRHRKCLPIYALSYFYV